MPCTTGQRSNPDQDEDAAEATHLIGGTIAVLVLFLVGISLQPVVRTTIAGIGRLPGLAGLAERLTVAYDATRTVLAPAPLLITVGISLIAWFAECVGTWMILDALGTTASLDQSTFLYAFSTVFGAPSPGGLGMADVALAEGALQIVDGITPGQALAGSLLVRVATLWFGVLLGAIALLRMETVIEDARQRSP